MSTIDYIGFDVHKKTISFCAKAQDRRILDEGTILARRADLSGWAKARPRPWEGAMEATLFTGWIYDHWRPLAQKLKGAHPAMRKAIAASKKKNDRVDRATLEVARKLVAYLMAVDKSGKRFPVRSSDEGAPRTESVSGFASAARARPGEARKAGVPHRHRSGAKKCVQDATRSTIGEGDDR